MQVTQALQDEDMVKLLTASTDLTEIGIKYSFVLSNGIHNSYMNYTLDQTVKIHLLMFSHEMESKTEFVQKRILYF